MGFNIGDVALAHGVLLAPMAGVSDRSFRALCREAGAEYTVSEMVSAKALCYEQRSKRKEYSSSATVELATLYREDYPTAVQIFGSEPEFMAEAARLLSANSYKGCRSEILPSAIDINMGCPVKKITSNGEGSALLKNPQLAEQIVRAVVSATHLPVTVKIRSGWDSSSINAPEVAKRLEGAGASAICIHARTREQLYSPGIDLSVIEAVKKSVNIPVIGNGDIYTAEDAIVMLRECGCDGIMIGRGAMGNPWLFSEISARLEGRDYRLPSVHERLAMAQRHLCMMLEEHGEHVGLAQAKKHMAWYISGMRGCAAARTRIMNSKAKGEILAVFSELAESLI